MSSVSDYEQQSNRHWAETANKTMLLNNCPLLIAAKANNHGYVNSRWSRFKKVLFCFPFFFFFWKAKTKTSCWIIEKITQTNTYQVFAADKRCCSHDFCVLCFHTALNFLLGLNSCQHFSIATCFLHDIQQVVLPPERLGLQPRENFTLWKNGKSVTAGAAKTTHLLSPDRRLTQHAICMVWVRDIMIVIMWDPALPARRRTYLVLWSRGYSWGSCGLAATCTILICLCLCDWLHTL